MIPFIAQVRALGGVALSAQEYKAEFLTRLSALRCGRIDGVLQGTIQPDELMVPGVRPLLAWLKARGVPAYLASGSPHREICREARSFGLINTSKGSMVQRPRFSARQPDQAAVAGAD